MRIIIVNHGIAPLALGGMEAHTYQLALGLSRCGVDTDVVVPKSKKSASFPFAVHQLPWPRRPIWLWSNYEFSRHVKHWLRGRNVDLLFGQGFNLLACVRGKSWPVVFHPHGLDMFAPGLRRRESLRLAHLRCAARYLARHSDATISLGGELTRILAKRVGVPAERIAEIPNCVDISQWSLSSAGRTERSFLFVGRLAFNKGIDILGDALELLRGRDFSLTIVGDGPLRREVELLAKRDSRVRYLGPLQGEALRQQYKEHETLVFTSRFEGMPTVVLEGMASGCAVLATQIGAVDVAVTSDTGILVEPGAEAIAKGWTEMLEMSPADREAMGLRGRRRVEDLFSWDARIPDYVALFERLIRSHQGRST